MWTQRDQVQAYQFLRRRLVSALVAADANHPVSPSRRLILSSILGLAAVLLVAGGFGVYGLLKPGAGADWRKTGQVVLATDTGASYVLGGDGRLHPMRNYASARLLAGGNGSATVSVPSSALHDAPRGATLGIAGAPEALPAGKQLLAGPWTVCAQRRTGGPAAATPTTTVLVGARPAGTAVPASRGLVVEDPDGTRYLLVAATRYRVATDRALVAIGFDAVDPVPVPASFVAALPAGPDLAAATVPHTGSTGVPVGGKSRLVGQVLRAATVGSPSYRYYVVRADGLAALTETQAALLLGAPGERAAYGGAAPKLVDVAGADVADAKRAHAEAADFPARLPRPVTGADRLSVCATGSGGTPSTLLLATSPAPAGAKPVPVSGRTDRVANEIYLPPGRAALVSAGSVYLLTDQGERFRVADSASLAALGYGSVRPTPVPAALLALFPSGPTLSTAAAASTG